MTPEQVDDIVSRRALPFPAEDCLLIETHASFVILAGRYAYKIKKPVRFSFLDFSTLEKRRYYCHREWQLNARLAPGMYLGVLPVRETADGLCIGGARGVIADYVLLMRRLDENRQMDRQLQLRAVTRDHIRQIADQITAFHRGAVVVPGAESAAKLAADFADLLSVRDYLSRELGKAAGRRLGRAVGFAGAFLQRHEPHIRRRNQLGWVVDGHGDLHSRNILLLPESPVIFDCIEFNDDLRRLDVLNEIAFFCMDLDYYRHAYLAEAFLVDYCNRLPAVEDDEDLQLFHFFKFYRANVRLKINCLRAKQEVGEGEEEDQATRQAVRDYFELLEGYLEKLRP